MNRLVSAITIVAGFLSLPVSDGGCLRSMLSEGNLPPCQLPGNGLPLTAFEEFMLLDDRPSHPMVIVARFDFTDGPPPPALADAFEAALLQEPLLTARVTTRARRRPR